MTTPIPPNLRVLFFDVFGTCVAQRTPVGDELWRAAREALDSPSSTMNGEVRRKAAEMTYEQWFDLGGEWNTLESHFVRASIAQTSNVDWVAVDAHRIGTLCTLLEDRGLILPSPSSSSTGEEEKENEEVGPGSLFSATQLSHLGKIWHRLPPWPDTCAGVEKLNRKYKTATLSNTYTALIQGLVSQGKIPFQHVFCSEMFGSYKPNAKVYLGAAAKLGVKPEECGLVAAHLSDLKGAKKCGFYAIYVERELEEKNPELVGEGIPDLVVKLEEGGLLGLAEKLGISSG